MANIDVVNASNEKVGSVDLADEIFEAEVKPHLLWEVVRNQMANRRAGTKKTKSRAEVAYTGSKMYRQKGTGRARAGSRRSGVRVGGGPDAADDWIAERAGPGDVVITDDLPLAARCVAKEAHVLTTRGAELTEANVGDAVATRDLMQELREAGLETTGPSAYGKKERSTFLSRLDALLHRVTRSS